MERFELQAFNTKFTINCKGRLVSFHEPCVMGIINVTPDSFVSESRKSDAYSALKQAETMLDHGALILDIGGYSSRPGANDVSEEEELRRVLPVIEKISSSFPEAIISIDTFRSRIAKEAIASGAHLINDISAGDDDDNMLEIVAGLNVPYIMMHKKGSPKTMQLNPQYDDVVVEVLDYLAAKKAKLNALGVHDIIIDPGFGFGKNIQHNYALMQQLSDFRILGLPVLVGISRKSLIQKLLGVDTTHSLNGSSALHTIALLKGANILRVHDVKEAVECIKIVKAVNGTF